jgi:hypothetical protein
MTTWTTLCKRTEDPKLRFIEALLKARGIPCRRAGYSFHAPILQVREEDEVAAWDVLGEKLPGRGRRHTLDDMPDDHPLFEGFDAAGAWLATKAAQQQATVGTQQAAKNLRKQGVPLNVALAILAPR